jgi:inner membrane protein
VPTVGHLAVGLAGWRLHGRVHQPVRPALVYTALATFQDLDLFLPHAWGGGWVHRGALHSPAVALVAAAIGLLLLWDHGDRAKIFLLAFATAASHGLLDTLTRGGVGVMLLWPLSLARFESPWEPLPPSPFSTRHGSPRFLLRLAYEALFFAPLFLWALWPRRSGRGGTNSAAPTPARPDP